MHNGYVPTKLERKLKYKIKDIGYFESPYTGFKINMCRGAYFLGDNTKSDVILPDEFNDKIISGLDYENKNKALLVVTKGVSKYAFLPFGNPSVTEINIQSVNYEDYDEEKILDNKQRYFKNNG